MKDHNWQVSNLELSKRLKELGVKQESLWYWNQDTAYRKPHISPKPEGDWAEYNITKHNYVSAFTVAELGEMLPKEIIREGELPIWLYLGYLDNKWEVTYCVDVGGQQLSQYVYIKEDTEANARAKMLIYLKEKSDKIA